MTRRGFEVNGVRYGAISKPAIGICLDGTGPEYLIEAMGGGYMPVMKELQSRGTFATALSIMPSYTNPNNIAIATGVGADVNGICGNTFYDAETDREVMMNDPQYLRVPTIFEGASRAGYVVAVVTAKDKLLKLLAKGWDGVAFSGEYANRAEVEGLGNVAEALKQDPPHYSKADINGYTMRAALLAFKTVKPDLMYISLPDCVQHRAAPGTTEANVMLQEVDVVLGQLLEAGATLGITADHGMSLKIKPDGTPNVIYLEEVLGAHEFSGTRVILPVADPYVSHHGMLGSFATVYCHEADLDRIHQVISTIPGIAEAIVREEACEKYSLPPDRVGDLVLVAEPEFVLGRTSSDHDLSVLNGPLRSHGGLSERLVPFVFSQRIDITTEDRLPPNYQLYMHLLNADRQ